MPILYIDFLIFSFLCNLAVDTSAIGDTRHQRYAFFDSGMTLEEFTSAGVTVLSHTPTTKSYCLKAKSLGIKAYPYISLYKVVDTTAGDCSAEIHRSSAHTQGLPLVESPFWKEVDAAKHSAWILRDKEGKVYRPFNDKTYPSALLQSCCNHRSLIAAYERGVRNVMKSRQEVHLSTMFIQLCYSAKLGLHHHDWPDKNNAECYQMALAKVHEVVKSYGEDRVIILNLPLTDSNNMKYTSFGDFLMWENFGWQHGFQEDKEPLAKIRRWEPRSWKDLMKMSRQYSSSINITTLTTYLPKQESEAKNAFFIFTAALAGFEHWTSIAQQRKDILRRIYRIRTGCPISDVLPSEGAFYRQFEHAVVFCNPSDKTVNVQVVLPASLTKAPVELCEMKSLKVESGNISMALPSESGRVVVSWQAAFDNLIREIKSQVLTARLYLEEREGKKSSTKTTNISLQLKSIEIIVTALQNAASSCNSENFLSPSTEKQLFALQQTMARLKDLSTKDSFLTKCLNNIKRHVELAMSLVKIHKKIEILAK